MLLLKDVERIGWFDYKWLQDDQLSYILKFAAKFALDIEHSSCRIPCKKKQAFWVIDMYFFIFCPVITKA